MTSPFSDRSMITDPTRFFGRTRELRAIFNALAAQKPQCVSIIGQRRIGRSSLLKHVEQIYQNHLPQPTRYHFAYLDVSHDTCRTPHEFYAEAAQALLGKPYESLAPHQCDDLLIPTTGSPRPRYVLLLDEFNALQRRCEQFDDDFYDGLRARANDGDLTFVLASHLRLHEVAVQNNFTSTFFGIFTPVFLEEFSLSEARTSVLRQTAKPLRDQDFRVVMGWLNSPYHPLKLNIAADLIWQNLPSPQYKQLKIEYDKQIAHTFGHDTRTLRSKKGRRDRLQNLFNWIRGSIEWFFADHRYLIVIVLVVIPLLMYLGYFELEQFIDAVIPNASQN